MTSKCLPDGVKVKRSHPYRNFESIPHIERVLVAPVHRHKLAGSLEELLAPISHHKEHEVHKGIEVKGLFRMPTQHTRSHAVSGAIFATSIYLVVPE